jgi:hypothetical protein
MIFLVIPMFRITQPPALHKSVTCVVEAPFMIFGLPCIHHKKSHFPYADKKKRTLAKKEFKMIHK